MLLVLLGRGIEGGVFGICGSPLLRDGVWVVVLERCIAGEV